MQRVARLKDRPIRPTNVLTQEMLGFHDTDADANTPSVAVNMRGVDLREEHRSQQSQCGDANALVVPRHKFTSRLSACLGTSLQFILNFGD